MSDSIKSPAHYELLGGYKSITLIASAMTEEQWFGFCLGNNIKYKLRAGKKGTLADDLAKADEYEIIYESHKGLCR